MSVWAEQPKGAPPVRMMLQNARFAGALLAAALLAAVALAGVIVQDRESAAQGSTSIGVDADPTGNTATSLGPIDSCVSVSTGDTFDVDILVTDVVDLLAWEVYFVYDGSIISIVDHDVYMFQAADGESNIFDFSEVLPDLDARYGVSAADLADPPAPDSGSGVLARLTLKAEGPGISLASIPLIDANNDGRIDLGPFLNDVHGDPIDDVDDDGFFDGQIFAAQIAVDTACPTGGVTPTPTQAATTPSPTSPASPTVETTPAVTETATATTPAASQTATVVANPTPTQTPTTEDEGSTWTGLPWIIGYVVAGLAVLLVAGVAFVAVTRRRAG
jgi:hypothetical protein